MINNRSVQNGQIHNGVSSRTLTYRYNHSLNDDENIFGENLCCDKYPQREIEEIQLQNSLERNKNCQNRPHSCVDFPNEGKSFRPFKETSKTVSSNHETQVEANLLSTTTFFFEPYMGKRRLNKSLTEPNFRREKLNLLKATTDTATVKEKTSQIFKPKNTDEGQKMFLRKLSFQESKTSVMVTGEKEKPKSKSENQLFPPKKRCQYY
jgi:hypothetical protein